MSLTNSVTVALFRGQCAPAKGLGGDLLTRYPEQTARARDVLGYDVARLCLENTDNRLGNTRYLQPALFFVNSLYYRDALDRGEPEPDILMGHSLGEYNALLAAGAFDFETGLRIVAKRGELMFASLPGAMLAIKGMHRDELHFWLEAHELQGLDIAHDNSPLQTVVSGPLELVELASHLFEQQDIQAVRLNVPSGFHSHLMRPARDEFAVFLQDIRFSPLRIPVIANLTGRPYTNSHIASILADQMTGTVRWVDSIRYLQQRSQRRYYSELGGSEILMRLVEQIETAQSHDSLSASSWEEKASSTGFSRVVLLSALNLNVLRTYAAQWLAILNRGEYQEVDLPRIAYTSQVGRVAMDYRLALVVSSLAELRDGLNAWLAGDICDYVVEGQVQHDLIDEPVDQSVTLRSLVDSPVNLSGVLRLLDRWVQGAVVNWSQFYGVSRPQRIILPNYPFQLERHRVHEQGQSSVSMIRPLLECHASNGEWEDIQFSSYFTGKEFFITDHLFNNAAQLPSVVYLEMACAVAIQAGLEPSGLRLRHNIWTKPLYVHDACQVKTALSVKPNGVMAYQIYVLDVHGQRQTHGHGYIETCEEPSAERVDIEQLRAYCSTGAFEALKCYEHFEQVGVHYGESLQVIDRIEYGPGLAMVRFQLPERQDDADAYVLHPGVLGVALQSTFGLFQRDYAINEGAVVPVQLETLLILRSPPSRGWVVANFAVDDQQGEVRRMDIDVCDEQGDVCVRLCGFGVRMILNASLGVAAAAR